jgi:quercetin dioxygenase-like cupin family protein
MEGSAQEHDGRVATYRQFPQLSLYQRVDDQRKIAESSARKRLLRKSDRTWHRDLQRLVDKQNGFDERAVACFLRRLPPGDESGIHRHNFEAIGYVVKGRGWDIHDGEKIEWEEGDVLYVPPNVWHQHGNRDPNDEAIVLLMTDYPLLLHLGICTLEPVETWDEALSRPPAIPDPPVPGSTKGAGG